jgi:NADPH:quinone reductase
LQQDVTVFGTASAENRAVVEQRGVHFLNYRDANWMTKLREEASGMMDAAIDHTGANSIRSTVSPRGTVVRTAFAGRAGHELRDTATGSLRTFMRHFASPRERVCSVPAFVAVNPSDYRRLLSSQFERLTNGTLTAPTVDTEELGDVVAAHEKLSTVAAGRKLVLQMPTL